MTHYFPTRRASDLRVRVGSRRLCRLRSMLLRPSSAFLHSRRCPRAGQLLFTIAGIAGEGFRRFGRLFGPTRPLHGIDAELVVHHGRAFKLDARLKVSDFLRSEEHTSELQSLMRISYAVFCWKKK